MSVANVDGMVKQRLVLVGAVHRRWEGVKKREEGTADHSTKNTHSWELVSIKRSCYITKGKTRAVMWDDNEQMEANVLVHAQVVLTEAAS